MAIRTPMTTPTHSSDPKHAPAPTPHTWRVRTEKGDVFGPADLDTLKTWARDGRLAPTHLISNDGQNWVPVTSLADLEMDWVAEITPGSFYGPIHRDSIAELLREGSIRSVAPLFHRSSAHDANRVSERERALDARLQDVQQQLYARIAELESKLRAATGEVEQSQSVIRAKELEFESERQEIKASSGRLQAEIIKRDGRIAALEKDVHRLEQHAQELQNMDARLAEARRLAQESQRAQEQIQGEFEKLRSAHRELERTCDLAREQSTCHEHDAHLLREQIRTLKSRLDTARKQVQQVATALSGIEDATDAEVVQEPKTEEMKDGPPPLATPTTGGIKPGMSLADLEAQAQRELRQLGGKGAGLFKGRVTKG